MAAKLGQVVPPRVRNLTTYRKAIYLLGQRVAGSYVFIHINKCGGTSVERALGIPVKIHDTARQRCARIGARRWNKAFTFSVVRHPYDKVVSHYRFRVRTDQTGLGNRHLDLNRWVRAAYGDQDPRYYDNALMFAPCFSWLADDNGDILVDYVTFLETIHQDWQYIRARIGTDSDLPAVNRTQSAESGSETLDETSKEILRKHFDVDFQVFGYASE